MTVSSIEDVRTNYGAVLAQLGFRPDDPRSQAAVLVAQRYGLDPVLKHVVLVEGQVYVTRDGLLHIAHSSGQLDGLEVDEAVLSEDGKEWLSRARVYRKDMGRPFSMSGRYRTGKSNAKEMAEKVAVARSLRHAFDVAIATEDERQAGHAEPTRTRVTAAEIVQPKPELLAGVEGRRVEFAKPDVAADPDTGEVLPVEEPPAGWDDAQVAEVRP